MTGAPPQMRPGRGDRLVGRLRFDAGSLTLNLIATVGRRFGTPVERLDRPARLDEWVRGAGLSLRGLHAGVDDLERVRAFREQLTELVHSVVTGTAPPPTAVEAVNAANAAPSPALQPTSSGVELRVAADASVAGLLLPLVARDALVLLGGPDRRRIRECAARDCRMLFLAAESDRRRWCSSAHCGNRNRVAAHSARTRRA